jgi:hypothetical protein
MASGDSLILWRALDNEPPDADFATMDTILTASTDEPDDVIPVLDFDPGATNEFAAFSAVLPEHYGNNGITVTLMWTANVATGNVKWDVAFKSFTDDADVLTSKAYATIQTSTDAAPSVAREVVYTTIAFTNAQIDGLVAGEYFRLTVERDSADAADTMNSNDAELIAVYLKET